MVFLDRVLDTTFSQHMLLEPFNWRDAMYLIWDLEHAECTLCHRCAVLPLGHLRPFEINGDEFEK